MLGGARRTHNRGDRSMQRAAAAHLPSTAPMMRWNSTSHLLALESRQRQLDSSLTTATAATRRGSPTSLVDLPAHASGGDERAGGIFIMSRRSPLPLQRSAPHLDSDTRTLDACVREKELRRSLQQQQRAAAHNGFGATPPESRAILRFYSKLETSYLSLKTRLRVFEFEKIP